MMKSNLTFSSAVCNPCLAKLSETHQRIMGKMPTMSMADRIRHARESAGLSQADVARHFNLSRGAVAQWEMGKTGPDRNRVPELASLLGVSVGYLLEGGDDSGIVFGPGFRDGPESEWEADTIPIYMGEPREKGAFIVTSSILERIPRPAGIPKKMKAFGIELPVETNVPKFSKDDLLIVTEDGLVYSACPVILELKQEYGGLCYFAVFQSVTLNSIICLDFNPDPQHVEFRMDHVSRLLRVYFPNELLRPAKDLPAMVSGPRA